MLRVRQSKLFTRPLIVGILGGLVQPYLCTFVTACAPKLDGLLQDPCAQGLNREAAAWLGVSAWIMLPA